MILSKHYPVEKVEGERSMGVGMGEGCGEVEQVLSRYQPLY
jgi:hypothetical protein